MYIYISLLASTEQPWLFTTLSRHELNAAINAHSLITKLYLHTGPGHTGNVQRIEYCMQPSKGKRHGWSQTRSKI